MEGNRQKEKGTNHPRGLHPDEKTNFVAINKITERWAWETTGMVEGSVEQSCVFTYLCKVFFGGLYSMSAKKQFIQINSNFWENDLFLFK